MATLHTHTPAALGRPTNLMHDTHACTNPTATTAPTWEVEAVTPVTLKEASVFINASRKELFPSLGYDTLLDNPKILETSCVLMARDGNSNIVAAIAYIPFDYRFPHLPSPVGASSTPSSTANSSSSSLHTSVLPPENPYKIVEILRLFVLPQCRRHGLAASLFRSLQDRAIASGIQCMYLHTHPFLPGAIRFWEKRGFHVIRVDEDDEVWRTHHMQMMLEPPELQTRRQEV